MRKIVVKSTSPDLVLYNEQGADHDKQIARTYVDTFGPIFKQLRTLAPSFSYDVFTRYLGRNAPHARGIFEDVYRAKNNVIGDLVEINGEGRTISSVLNEVAPEQLAPYETIAAAIKEGRTIGVYSTAVVVNGDTLAVDPVAIDAVHTYTMSANALAYYNALGELAKAFDAFANSVQMYSAPHIHGLTQTADGWAIDTEWLLFHLGHKTN